MSKPELVKVQIAAEFVRQDGQYKEPGIFGPVEMTARQWAEFDLQAAIEQGVAQAANSAEGEAAAPQPSRAARRSKPRRNSAPG